MTLTNDATANKDAATPAAEEQQQHQDIEAVDGVQSGKDPEEEVPSSEYTMDNNVHLGTTEKNVPQWHLVAYGLLFAAIMFSMAVGITVVVKTKSNNSTDTSLDRESIKPILTPREKYSLLIEEIGQYPSLSDKIGSTIPAFEDVDTVDRNDFTRDPSARALAWSLYRDSQVLKSELVERFALASFYFATNSPDETAWFLDAGWLQTHHKLCSSSDSGFIEDIEPTRDGWFGVHCNQQGKVEELVLPQNGLIGSLPPTLVLLKSLKTISVPENKLMGSLDPTSLPTSLSFLYLQQNHLSGDIPQGLISQGHNISTFHLQGNDLSGVFPFCAQYDDHLQFRIDCEKVDCSCCDPVTNCY